MGTTPLDPELKALLVCPRCRGELAFFEEKGEIQCPKCRLVYAIEDGIPVMLIDEAKPL